ncbi:hypothetical protein ACP3TJ_10370 [Desulforudis sp. 1088]|uniref:hypothetical protein n=1 Tax=unclassified Candidatus Desulforudis TaxID=2635950 RepID=UPI003CE520A4
MRHAPFPDGPLVVVQQRRCLLVLGEQELLALLAKDPDLWQAALQRGKALRRTRKARGRANLQEPEGRDRRPGFA